MALLISQVGGSPSSLGAIYDPIKIVNLRAAKNPLVTPNQHETKPRPKKIVKGAWTIPVGAVSRGGRKLKQAGEWYKV